MKTLTVLSLIALAAATPARSAPAVPTVERYVTTHERAILGELVELLSVPNVATNAEDAERNAQLLLNMLRRRGMEGRLLRSSDKPRMPPAVFAELRVPGARRTVVFYAHYDGQPVNRAEWRSDPWMPVVRAISKGAAPTTIDWRRERRLDPEWRVFGRSASDDKSPIVAMLTALDAIRASGRKPSVNLKFFFEGEEEQASPNLRDTLAEHRELLSSDLWIFADGPRHQSGANQIYLGARGAMSVSLTAFGANRPLHSGHYGNWAPNPAVSLARLLATLRDEDGRILIRDFYDDVRPLTDSERRALAAIPDTSSELRRELALGRTEGGEPLGLSVVRPALNLRSLQAGDPISANAIPTTARASLDFRLVPDQVPETVRQRLERHLREAGWHVVQAAPDEDTLIRHPKVIQIQWSNGYAAQRTDIDSAAAVAVARLVNPDGRAPLTVPMLGGSVPMSLFAEATGSPIIGVPIVNYDNNQHAADENVTLGSVWTGIATYARLMEHLRW